MKTIVMLLVLVCSVSLAHTDLEKGRYVDGILMRTMYVASDDSWALEGRDPDPHNVLGSWEGFLGRPGGEGWTSGWSMAERRAAFDWYLERLSTTNCCCMSSLDKSKVFIAFATCKKFAYTNAVPMLRGAALNPNCVHRDLAIEVGVDYGNVSPQTTDFVETVVTNMSGYTREERAVACSRYASKVLSMSPTNSHDVVVRDAALRCLYRNRYAGVVSANMLDKLFVSKIDGYEYSSNRLEYARFVLACPERRRNHEKKYVTITNQLLSSEHPLAQLTIGEGK